MSRNSKNARNLAKARQISAMHKNGEKGPSRTVAVHGKKWGYRDNPEVAKRLAEMLKSTAPRTAAQKILEGAGGATVE